MGLAMLPMLMDFFLIPSVAAISPEFGQTLRKVSAVEGRTAKFECSVTGTPKPDISW